MVTLQSNANFNFTLLHGKVTCLMSQLGVHDRGCLQYCRLHREKQKRGNEEGKRRWSTSTDFRRPVLKSSSKQRSMCASGRREERRGMKGCRNTGRKMEGDSKDMDNGLGRRKGGKPRRSVCEDVYQVCFSCTSSNNITKKKNRASGSCWCTSLLRCCST